MCLMSKPWPAWPITKADGTGITHVPLDSNHDVESPLPGPLDHIVGFLQIADAVQERYPTPCLAHSRVPLPLSSSRIGVFSSGTGDSGPDELVHESLSFYSDGRRHGSGGRRRNWLGPGPAPLSLNVDNVERPFRQVLQGHHIPCPVTHSSPNLSGLSMWMFLSFYMCADARGYLLHPFLELTRRCAMTMTPVCLTRPGSPTGWKLGLPVCQKLYKRWNLYAAASRIHAERYDRPGLARFYWLYTNSYVR